MQSNIFSEMLPVIAFFLVYYFTKNIFLATGVCIGISWLQLLFTYLKHKNIPKNMWLSTGLITLFGSFTIIFHNKTFVMLKPTVLYWIIGVGMLLAPKFKKNGIKILLEKQVTLPDNTWSQVNLMWGLFFILMGIVNLVVAFNYSEQTWVNFKMFGGLSLILMFTIIQVIWINLQSKKYK